MSNPGEPAPGSTQDWLRHARSDLTVARRVESDPDVLPSQVVFHAQQAAEKALKGALIHVGTAFPLTHDLSELVKRWTASGRVWPEELAGVGTLNPFAVESRYPGYIHELTCEEVSAAIALAAKVVAWAETQTATTASPSPAA